MAALASRMTEQLTCSICNSWLKEPRRLPCGDTYCLTCIDNLPTNHDGTITCPDTECTETLTLPAGGARNLRVPKDVVKMMNKFRCMDCDKIDVGSTECENCACNACTTCHTMHEMKTKCDVLKLVRDIKTKSPDEELTMRMNESSTMWRSLNEEIDRKRDELTTTVDQLIEQLKQVRADKLDQLKLLQDQAKENESVFKEVLISKEFASSTLAYLSLSDGNHTEMNTLLHECAQVNDKLNSIQERLEEKPSGAVPDTNLFLENIQSFSGALQRGDVVCAAPVQTDQPIQVTDPPVYAGRELKRIVDLDENPPKLDYVCDIAVSPITGQMYITGWRSGSCHILVYDNQYRYLTSIDTRIKYQYSYCFISVNNHGELIITNYGSKDIVYMSESGERLRRVQTGHLCGGAVEDENRQIFVCHPGLHCISVLDQTGGLVRRIEEGQIQGPSFISLSDDKLYVSDNGGSIIIFRSSGEMIKTIKSPPGYEEMRPCGICTDFTDQILCTDDNNHCVHVFSTEGDHLTSLQSSQQTMRNPIGITILPSGDIVVVDWFKKLFIF